jgi:hypothetical protein
MGTKRTAISIAVGFFLVCMAGSGCDDVQAHLDGPPPDAAVLDGAYDAPAAEPDLPDPECPMGRQGPAYCLANKGIGASCGPCGTVGKVCEYFEGELTCECDHQWHCSWCGGTNCKLACTRPDGGYVCVDAG